jgi:hypothetical protein
MLTYKSISWINLSVSFVLLYESCLDTQNVQLMVWIFKVPHQKFRDFQHKIKPKVLPFSI